MEYLIVMDMRDTTQVYCADSADDLTDTALEAIEGRKALRDLLKVALIAAGALETRGMRATGMRLRELSAKVQRTFHTG